MQKSCCAQVPFQVIKDTSNTGILNIMFHGLTLGKLRFLKLKVDVYVYVHIWLFMGRRSTVPGDSKASMSQKLRATHHHFYWTHNIPLYDCATLYFKNPLLLDI